MLKAVLFDLDGTLLPLNQNKFVETYLKELAPRVTPIVDSGKLVKQLLSSTRAMIDNRDASLTNEQVFMRDFFSHIGVPEGVLMPLITDFYEHHFDSVRRASWASPYARQAVEAVIERGLIAVVATNPVFPLIAVRRRMGWNHLEDLPFQHITSYETSHFCKPHVEYYLEIASRLQVRPDECLMVGNDVEEDLVAAKTGMMTYLVTDCLLNLKGLSIHADYTGTLSELAAFLGSLPFKLQAAGGK